MAKVRVRSSSPDMAIAANKVLRAASTTMPGALEFQDGTITDDGSQVTFSGTILCLALPTSDPAVAGALWNDTGTVKISAGA